MKIIRPWRELNMVNIYLKIMVSELKLNNPNSQVIPSNGRMTPEALTPVLTFSTCVLFCMYFVPIIWRITKIKTTILTCKSCRNFGKTSNHVTLLASRRYMARYCFRSIICLALLIPLPFFFFTFSSFVNYHPNRRRQPTFRDATTAFPAKWRLRNECRNSILMTRHYPDLVSTCDHDWPK